MLTVKNTNSFLFASRYNGHDLTFPVNEKVMIDTAAASHIFGFGTDDQARYNAIVRHGWANSTADMEAGRKILSKFVFVDADEAVAMEPVAVETDPPANAEPAPAEVATADADIPSFVGSGRRSKA